MILYLFKSTAILFVLYLFYKLLLEKESMHVFKRFYLLSAIVIAFIIPLLTFTQYVEPALLKAETMPIQIVSGDLNLNSNIPQFQYNMDILIIIFWTIYGLGVALFGLRFANNLYRIYTKIKNNPIIRSKQFSHVLLFDLKIPHTFLNYIFLNKQNYKDDLVPKEVLIHEQTHARQKHTIDILYIELLQMIFWFNPLFYYIKKSIKLNHEFLADHAVLNKGIQISTYQKLLLMFTSNSSDIQLSNAINYSLIKKRFTVMKTQTSNRTIWFRSLVILPLLAVLIYGFSEKVIVEKENLTKEKNEVINDLQKITSSNQSSVNKVINIKINSKKQILINEEKLVSLKTFGREIKNIMANYSSEQLTNTLVIIEAPDTIDMNFIIDVSEELRKVGVNFIRKYVAGNNSSQENISQDKIEKASKEQIGEYNKLAKKYNDMPQGKMDIIYDDVKRLMYIYRIMTVKQRKNAEPYPVFPPPPPSPTFKKKERVYKVDTPTPPIPGNPTFKQKEKNKTTIRGYVGESPVTIYENKNDDPVFEYKYDPKRAEVIGIVDHFNVEELVENNSTEPRKVEFVEVLDTLNNKKVYEYKTENGDKWVLVLGTVTEKNSLLVHVTKMAEKGATFYFEDNKITSNEAIKLIEKDPTMSCTTSKINTNSPIVKLSARSIESNN